MSNYIIGSILAVFLVGSVLIFFTLELTGNEVIWLLFILMVSAISMIIFEIRTYKKHMKPIHIAFTSERPSLFELKEAFFQIAQFPTLTFKRIMVPHLLGLSIPATITTSILITLDVLHMPYYYIGYAWLGAILIATMHGLIEFFLTLKIIQPLLIECVEIANRLYQYKLNLEDGALVSIKQKLLLSSLFLAIYPICLFSLATQIQLSNYSIEMFAQYWQWAGTILLVVVIFAVYGSFLFVNDIKRPMQELEKAFSNVEKGEYQSLDNSYTDEFSKLIGGFNHMVSSIQARDETNRQLLESFFTVFAATLDARDPYTAGHSLRVADYAVKVGKKAGLENEQLVLLKKSALLHDIGKIGINDSILLKDGKLSEEEFAEIKRHPLIGEKILNQIQPIDAMVPLIPGVKHHHERYDGKGYPSGLKGEEIPPFGRILAVADAFDAMTSDRPYRSGMSYEKAMSILYGGKGEQWDAYYAQLLIEVVNENHTAKIN